VRKRWVGKAKNEPLRGAQRLVELNIKDIVKNNLTHFSFLRGENAYYTVVVNRTKYVYPVNLKDLCGASIFAEMKAITMMRYIRKALEDKTFVKAG
jgi:hypothetical protein